MMAIWDFFFLACESMIALARSSCDDCHAMSRQNRGAREKAIRSIVSSSIRPLRRTRGWWS